MRYQVGGSLQGDHSTYIVRQADEQLYTRLKAGEFCYVLDGHHMGKSSLLQHTKHRLEQEGYTCIYLNATLLSSKETTPMQWYKGMILSLFSDLNLVESMNFQSWWKQQTGLSPVQILNQFIEQILLNDLNNNSPLDGKSKPILIFIDGIHSLLNLNFPVNDFFAWIHDYYEKQAYNPNFKRLGFTVFGVASPSDFIADQSRSPFKIGRAIELSGFELHEASPLLQGLEEVVSKPQIILQHIIYWTGGQPLLTQKLCQLIVRLALENSRKIITVPPGAEGFWIEYLVRSRIIQHWLSQDEPEHFRTICDRLVFHNHLAGKLLHLYQRILQAEEVSKFLNTEEKSLHPIPIDDSQEQAELLLSGLVEKRNGYLRVKNPIYRNIFNNQWVIKQIALLDKERS